jgi:hypothetical protein
MLARLILGASSTGMCRGLGANSTPASKVGGRRPLASRRLGASSTPASEDDRACQLGTRGELDASEQGRACPPETWGELDAGELGDTKVGRAWPPGTGGELDAAAGE